MNSRKEYERLPGRGVPAFSALGASYRLYMSDDHLLFVHHNAAVEEYRRLFFKDIQAIQITPSRRFMLNNLIAFILLLIGMVLYIAIGDLWSGAFEFFVASLMLGMPIAVLLGNIIKGGTCNTYLYTGVQALQLPSLNRIKTARKVLQMIEPSIRSAQPEWTDDRKIPVAAPVHQALSTAGPPNLLAAAYSFSTRWHIRLAILAGLLAASSIYDIFQMNNLKNLFDSVLTLLLIVVDVLAIVQQRNASIPAMLKVPTWSVIIITFVVMYITAFGLSLTHVFQPESAWLTTEPSNPLMAFFAALITVVYGAVSVTLFIGLMQYNRQSGD